MLFLMAWFSISCLNIALSIRINITLREEMTAISMTWDRDDQLYDEWLVVGENNTTLLSRLTFCSRPQISDEHSISWQTILLYLLLNSPYYAEWLLLTFSLFKFISYPLWQLSADGIALHLTKKIDPCRRKITLPTSESTNLLAFISSQTAFYSFSNGRVLI